MQLLMVNSTQMSVNTAHSQLCLLASLGEQWRKKRMLKQDWGADNMKHDGYLHSGQIGEEGKGNYRVQNPPRTHLCPR